MTDDAETRLNATADRFEALIMRMEATARRIPCGPSYTLECFV